MTEPVVTLTDYVLVVECVVLAMLCWRGGVPGPYRRWLTVFFVSAAVAPLLGGTVHGFFPAEDSTAHRVLWVGTMLAIGVTAVAGWATGGLLVLPPRARRLLMMFAWSQAAVYAAVVLFVSRSFAVAVVDYLPAAVFLLVAFVLAWRRTGERRLAVGAAGLGLALAAAAGQQAGVGIHPVWLDHNALYHLIQAVSFLLLYRAASWLVRRASPGVAPAGGPPD